MLSSLRSAALIGVEALPVVVEVDVSYGMPIFTMVGLPDASVRESRDRVRSAIRNSGFSFPSHRVTVNLAPADVRKAGASYDLPIALGILAASGVVEQRRVEEVVLLGELSLDGAIQPVRGALPVAVAARREGKRAMLLPRANAPEARVVEGLQVLPVDSLIEAVQVLNAGLDSAVGRDCSRADRSRADSVRAASEPPLDFADVTGQSMAKRALEVAAAGGHNVLLIGAPGGGKTMMARRLPSVLPPLEFDEALDCTSIHSVAGTLAPGTALMQQRPFRAPHHTISEVAMVGGGSFPRPGEISLAHNGVLFLDELPEFDRRVLEVAATTARGRSCHDRARGADRRLSCPVHVRRRDESLPVRLSRRPAAGVPVHGSADRALRRPDFRSASRSHRSGGGCAGRRFPGRGCSVGEPSRAIRGRVLASRAIQRRRFEEVPAKVNATMEGALLREHCPLDARSQALLDAAIRKFCLSARGYDRVLRVSRTIADLAASPQIQSDHVAEALQYRIRSG